MRNFTGVSTGTCAHCGTKEYCSPIILTVTEPSGSAAVPRLLSANSPPRCKVVGSMVSTLLGGCSAWVTPVTTMMAIITASMASMMVTQRFSVRAISSSGMIPSSHGGRSGWVRSSANRASRHEKEEVEEQPADEQQPHRYAGQQKRPARTVFQRCGGRFRIDRRGDMIGRGGRGRTRPIGFVQHEALLSRRDIAGSADLLVVGRDGRDVLVSEILGHDLHRILARLA